MAELGHLTNDRRRVVITGMGVVSAAGCTLLPFWHRLVSGRSAIVRIRRFDASGYPSRIAAEVAAEDLPSIEDVWVERGRIAQYAAIATRQAVTDAGLGGDGPARERAGLLLAAGTGSFQHEEIVAACSAARATRSGDFDWPAFSQTLRASIKPHGAERRSPGSIAAALAREFGLLGPVMTVMTACAGGTQAIGDALRWIRLGRADVVVAGGADCALYPIGLASFCLLGALSTRNCEPSAASRPFDRERDGFVMGEGAGVVVMEERERALARGARIYAEVAGFGGACDAHRATDPHPEGRGAVLAMERALRDAAVPLDEIDYVNAHGTATAANDRIETVAIKRVFGERAYRIPISSTKSMIGHATVAAGAIEAVVCALTLAHQVIHPTINLESPDPLCDLDYVPHGARPVAVGTVLSNSFAFGGQSACLVFRRH
jgi:3-oxoacyl-[acyl-carrier-protein] synthase II